MRTLVLDASVVFKWFRPQQPHVDAARLIREDYAAGRLSIAVPSLLFLEVLNAAARRWSWDDSAVRQLATDLSALAFEVTEPAVGAVAAWTSRGLTAYDAAYVAVAEAIGVRLVTDDALVTSVAAEVVLPLASYRG